MHYNILGKTGLRVSAVGFGGIPLQRVSERDAVVMVNKALDLGINFFDNARAYTDSEAKLGLAMQGRRKEGIIATKSLSRTKEAMAADIRTSLTNFQTDYIDLYQLHNVKDSAVFEQVCGADGALTALCEAKEAGLIRHIGITGHIKEFLPEAMEHPEIDTVQFPFNPIETNQVQNLFTAAKKTDAGIIIMKPLAGGALRNTTLALRYILQHPVSTVIPGMDALPQVVENAAAGCLEQGLTQDEQQLLSEEIKKLGDSFCRRCDYCQPCPQGIDISSVFLMDGYLTRYNLPDWAKMRYMGLPAQVDSCVECGNCEERCPYNLPIRQMLREAGERLQPTEG